MHLIIALQQLDCTYYITEVLNNEINTYIFSLFVKMKDFIQDKSCNHKITPTFYNLYGEENLFASENSLVNKINW